MARVQYFTAGTLDGFIADEGSLGMAPVTLGAGAPLLPRRITSAEPSLRPAEPLGQRIRIVLDVGRRE